MLKKFSVLTFAAFMLFSLPANAEALRIVALGDSLTAGYGLKPKEEYPAQLERALNADGYHVRVDNGGLSGDTAAGGFARIDDVLGGKPQPALVLVSLGANDMLRGLDPEQTKDSLRKILQVLQQRKIPAYLMGMKASSYRAAAYRKQFDAIYPSLAKEFNVPLYPFFLDGVAMNRKLNQTDGVHPTKEGVALMVEKTLPGIKKALDKIKPASTRK